MDLGLSGKVVIVLAASRGLGRAVAHGFSAEGARVTILSRDEEQLSRAAREISEVTGNAVTPRPCDITAPGELEKRINAVGEEHGGVDVLFNSCGGPSAGHFEQLDDSQWRHGFELTLLSFVRAVRAVLPHMERRGGGRILNLASFSARQPIDGLVLSNVFRPGVAGLTKSLANEMGPRGILVNTIAPGFIGTDRLGELNRAAAERLGKTLGEIEHGQASQIPLGRLGTPEEFARAVVWLGSQANTYVTGQLICIDGGLVKSI
jgi:3-oxoacyl-[acyl-carrier protein] reductase